MNPIGRILRDRRVRAGLSLRALARLLRVSDLHLSEMERGRAPIPAHLEARIRELTARADVEPVVVRPLLPTIDEVP